MPRRVVDSSRARCDVCGALYQPGDAVYAIADKYDESVQDRDVLVSFRHWACHTPVEELLADIKIGVDVASKRAQEALDRLRSKLR
jgi:hypothetical protein